MSYPPPAMVTRNPVLDQLATYPAEALYAEKRRLRAQGLEVFDFSVGDPIEPTAPQLVAAYRDAVPEVSQYPSVAGLAPFREACAAWVSRRFGVELDPEREILPSSGSKEAIFHLPLCVLDRSSSRRCVLFGKPGYPVYERGTRFAGGEPWGVELRPERGYRLEPWELSADELARVAVVWINYPHNPTAATVDRDYLSELYDFCRERDILLCSDECYVDLYFERPLPPSLLQIGRDSVLTFHSLSKRSGMTGYRSGFVAGDAALIDVLRSARANFGVASTTMTQRAACVAWGDEQHAERRRELFRAKRDVLCSFFDEVGLRYSPCRATLYLWLRTPGDCDPLAYAQKLASCGILVSTAPQLGVDQPYVRLALVPSLDDCRRAAQVWRREMKEVTTDDLG